MPDSRVHRFEKMPCCCETNVKADYVIGIISASIGAVLCFGFGLVLNFRNDEELLLLLLVLKFLASFLLIFGAYKRNRTAILI